MLTPWVTPAQIQAAPGALTDGSGGTGWLDPTVDASMLNTICCAASDILYRLSGRQFAQGGEAFVRPARVNRDCGCMPWWYASWGGWGSAWSLWPLGQQFPEGFYCGCKSDAELILPGPVQITQVVVNGAQLTPGIDYVLLNKRRLVRMQNGTPPVAGNNLLVWPCCQDLTLPENAEGSWYVRYAWGQPIPADGQLAALALAVELAKAFSGSPSALPERVTSLARQGVSAIVADPLTFVEKGLTGLPTCDLFIVSSNPFGLRRRASVMSPDTIAIEETPPYQPLIQGAQPVVPPTFTP